MDGFGLFGMSGEAIYRNFTDSTGPGDLAAAADLWKQLQDKHEQIAQRARALAVRMEAAWQGDAAGAAQRGALPLAIEHEQAAPLLSTDHDLFSRQVGSFNDARNSVVPVPPAPDQPSGFEILFSPGELVTYEQKLAEHNAAAQHNVDVMDGYEGASSYNGENLPASYGSLMPDSAGITVAPPSGGDPGQPGDDGSPGPRTETGHRPREGVNWTPHAAPGGPSAPQPGVGGESPQPPQGTRPGEYVPPPAVPTPGPGLPGSGPGVPVGGPPPVGGFVPVGGLSGGGAPGGSGGSSGPGIRGGAGVPGGGGQPGRGDAGHGPGGRTGAGPVAGGAAAEAAARGAAGARGVAGGGLPMGVGAGRGRGEEDIERKAPKYLEEPDPEGLLGTDVLTAPPVIGVDEENGEPDR